MKSISILTFGLSSVLVLAAAAVGDTALAHPQGGGGMSEAKPEKQGGCNSCGGEDHHRPRPSASEMSDRARNAADDAMGEIDTELTSSGGGRRDESLGGAIATLGQTVDAEDDLIAMAREDRVEMARLRAEEARALARSKQKGADIERGIEMIRPSSRDADDLDRLINPHKNWEEQAADKRKQQELDDISRSLFGEPLKDNWKPPIVPGYPRPSTATPPVARPEPAPRLPPAVDSDPGGIISPGGADSSGSAM